MRLAIASNPENYYGRLHELAMPVLVVTGDDDRIVPDRVQHFTFARKFLALNWLFSSTADMSLKRNAPINSWMRCFHF